VALAWLPFLAGAAPALGQDRVWWTHDKGSFQRTAGNHWYENLGDGVLAQFVETRRTGTLVELYDKSRDVTVQLFKDHCRAKTGNEKFGRLYGGRWSAAEEKAYTGLTEAALQKVCNKHWDPSEKGAWDVVSIKGYARGAESLYDITWRKMSGPDQNLVWDMSPARFNEEKAKRPGYVITVQSTWEVDGRRLHAAVWVHRATGK
jgi:hypothetical protein